MRALIFACLIATPAFAADDRILVPITFGAPAMAELQNRGEGIVISACFAG
jgi:hypothetical protein